MVKFSIYLNRHVFVMTCDMQMLNMKIHVAQKVYLFTTDRRTVTYYSTSNTLELIGCDSNTQRVDKSAFVSFSFYLIFRHCLTESRRHL